MNVKKEATWIQVSEKLTDFSCFFLYIKNNQDIIKNKTILTNSRFIYHYCKYERVENYWKYFTNNKDLAKYIKECDTVTLFYKDSIDEDKTISLVYKLAQKLTKRIIQIQITE